MQFVSANGGSGETGAAWSDSGEHCRSGAAGDEFSAGALKFLGSMEREYAVCFRQRTMERRGALARNLDGLVELMRVPTAC